MDPVVLGICSVRRLNFMAKIELFKGLLGFFLTKLGAFPFKRGESDFGAMREALRRLKEGHVVLIFVEGTRRIGNEPSKAQAGVGFLAMKSGVPLCQFMCKEPIRSWRQALNFSKEALFQPPLESHFSSKMPPLMKKLPSVF